MGEKDQQHQVFISFRGADVRKTFVSFLGKALERGCVNYYVDTKELKGEVLDILFQRIQESRLVLIILSENYMQSNWCIEELRTAIKDIKESRRKVIPIFYNVKVADVKDKWKVGEQAKGVEGEETVEEREKNVKEALGILTRHMGMRSEEYSNDSDFIEDIVKEVKKVLTSIEREEKVKASVNTWVRSEGEKQDVSSLKGTNLPGEGEEVETKEKLKLFGITQRVQKLQEKLGMHGVISKETRIIGVLGMAGIGKTTIAQKLFEEGKNKFHRRMFFDDIDKTSKEEGLTELRVRLLRKLLKKTDKTITEETTHESVETELLDSNVFLVLDNVSNKKQLEYLLGNRRWISQGSKVVIVTSDKSLVEDVVSDTYVVPGLNEKEGLECFCYHAFGDHNKVHEGSLMKQSREFVDYARGNPLALKVLGPELRGRDKAHWESKLRQLAQSPSNVLNVSYDGLSQQQKEAFLDVTCFFRSENHKFVTALVDSEADKGSSEIRDLADKFLIDITGGRVEMHNLLYTLGKKLTSKQQKRLRNHHEIIRVLKRKTGKSTINGIRGMFLDMSEVSSDTALSKEAFVGMDNLRYLKIYDSRFPQENEAGYKLHFSNGVKLPLQKIRYLHWLRFPGEEIPQDFNPKNLIDLKLPYSKIKRLWEGVKDTSKLTWVDLSHSVNLGDLSGLLGAQNLQRLNLEGCKELKKLDARMENLTSLVFLNLRGCSSLVSLAEMNMESLKTLILSDCSNLEEFQVISEQLEALYLDGTSLKSLPPSIIKLEKLVLLNLKDCTKLATVPDCLGNMKALQEVILSGCKKLETFPDLQENMRRLRIFLLDGTSIKEVPKLLQNPGLSRRPHLGVKGFPLLRHLCLRGNDYIQILQPDIGELYHLKYIDLKFCKNLASVPTLPPNLQRLNAHGCESLTTLGNPLAHLVLTDQIHATFIFSNCNKLDEDAKTGIVSYIQKKSQLMSDALDRYNLGSVVESFVGACFPGCEVHAWLSHQAYGTVIVLPKLSRHWRNNGTTGVVLCAVVSFTDCQDQNNHVLVKCTCEFKTSDGSLRQFSCMVGGNRPRAINSDHVFIGYTSWLQMKKQTEAGEEKNDCSYSDDQASLRFEVVDSEGRLVKICQVIKCGFSLVNESDEAENFSWEVNSSPADPVMGDSSIHGEASTMEVINQQGETSTMSNNNIHGLPEYQEERRMITVKNEGLRMQERSQQRETSAMGNNNDTSGVLRLLQDYLDDSELTDSDESQRIGDINQQGDAISIDDVSMLPPDSEESDESESNRQDETDSCLSSEDQEDINMQESGRATENTSVQMIKPVGLLCLMISISAGAAFILGKRKR